MSTLLWVSFSITITEISLDNLVKYAQSLPEEPDQNARAPQNSMRSLMRYIVSTLGLKAKSLFTASDFQKIMQAIIEKRSVQYTQGRLVEKVTPQVGDVYVVWGGLNGALHSLVRDLEELCKQGYISKDLIIADKSYYIFNGNVIGKDAYSWETFMLVLYLMYKNPKRVIYIKGDHEDQEHWNELLFGRELEKFNTTFWSSSGVEKSYQHMHIFFNSLPLALYVISADQTNVPNKKIVRFSYYSPDFAELNEAMFPYFFDIYTPSVISLLDKNKSPTIDYQIAAYIYAQNNTTEYTPSTGLLLQSKYNGATYWTTLASPILEFRKQYQFFNDAFVTITTADSLDAWTISLYCQDVRKNSGFKTNGDYYLLTGESIYDPLQAKVNRLKDTLQQLNRIKKRLYEDCLYDAPVLQEEENILSLIRRHNSKQLLAFTSQNRKRAHLPFA